MQSIFSQINGITLHAIDYGGNGTALLLLHGLTANAYAFQGLINNGLTNNAHVFSIDLRGRGLSEASSSGYTMEESALDIIGFLDAHDLQQCVLAGHSYGAFLSWYLAANYSERVNGVIAMDAAMRMHPRTLEMLGPSLGRLGQTYQNFEVYLDKVKHAPYLSFWDEDMLPYYQGDVTIKENGTVSPIPSLENMAKAAKLVIAEPWQDILLVNLYCRKQMQGKRRPFLKMLHLFRFPVTIKRCYTEKGHN